MTDASTGKTLRELRDATEADFRRLAEIAGLDPELDFRGVDLAGADFGTSDLKGFNFTDSDLTGANLSLAKTKGAIFDRATVRGVRWPIRSHRLRMLRKKNVKWAFHEEVVSDVIQFIRSSGRIPSLSLAMPPGSGRHKLLTYLIESLEDTGQLANVLVTTDSLAERDSIIRTLTDAFGVEMVVSVRGWRRKSPSGRIQVSTAQAVFSSLTGVGTTVLSDNLNLVVTLSRGTPERSIGLYRKYLPDAALISFHHDGSPEDERSLKEYELNFRYSRESAVSDGVLARARVLISDDDSVLPVILQQSSESHGAIIFHESVDLEEAAKYIGGLLQAAGVDWRLIAVDAGHSYQPRTSGTITLAKLPFAQFVDWGRADFVIVGTTLPSPLRSALEYPSAQPGNGREPVIYDFSDTFRNSAAPFANTRRLGTSG